MSGKTLYYAYDKNGRLKYLKEGKSEEGIGNPDDSGAITLTEYRYTNAGRIKEILTGNGIRTTYNYDEDGNVSRLTIGDGTEEGLLYDAFLLYDLNGNRTGKTGRRLDAGGKQAEMAVSYRYDSMNRLTNEDRGGIGERYAYDLCGNRLLKEQYSGSSVDATESCRYNERNELTERVKTGSLTIYSYDRNGSIISEEEEGRRSEYRYDLLNRQIYVKTLDGKEQENFYDGENLRAGVTENGKKTTFLYHNGEIFAECGGESAPIRRYIRGIGLSCVQTLDNNAYHAYHQDEQGSTVYITGQGRKTENFYQYDAFGNLLEKREDISNRILYTGQQYDQETGQYYLRARYYNPVVGRFLQEDTYRGDGLNLYAYCANNPVVYYDPSGYGKQSKTCKVQQQSDPEELPSRRGALREAKRDADIPYKQEPFEIRMEDMTEPEYLGGHVVTDSNGNVVRTREYHYKNRQGETIIIQDHSAGHVKGGQGSHFNVRPENNTRTGKVPGTKEHYPFKK